MQPALRAGLVLVTGLCFSSLASASGQTETGFREASARRRFAIEQMPMALGWHGVATALYFRANRLPVWFGLHLAGSTVGYFGTLLLASRLTITEARSHLVTALGYRGIVCGHSLDAWLKFQPWENRILAMWLGGMAGQAAGYALATGMSPGRAALVSACTDMGIVQGLCFGTVVNDLVFNDLLWHASPSVGILPGALVGTITGLALTHSRRESEGQVMVIRVFGLAGAVLPGAFFYSVSGRTSRRDQSVMAGLASGGSIAGALLGLRITRGRALSVGRGSLIAGTAATAGLAGAGLGYVGFRNLRAATGLATIGTTAGLVAGWLLASRLDTGNSGFTGRFTVSIEDLVVACADVAMHTESPARNLITVRF